MRALLWKKDAFKWADHYRLERQLVLAVIQVESAGDPWSCRYEPAYPYLETPSQYAARNGINTTTEEVLQRTSFGLMHVMGGVFRQYGWQGPLPEAFKPEMSLEYGCRHLARKASKWGDDPCTLYASFNAGSVRKTPGGMFHNQKNVDRFYQIYLEITSGNVSKD